VFVHSARARRRVRRGAVAAAVAAALLAGALVDGSDTALARPSHPTPAAHVPVVAGKRVDPKLGRRIAIVTAQLNRLAQQNARLDESYNVAVATAAAQQRSADQAQQNAQQTADEYEAAHRRFLEAVTQQYETGTDPTVGALLTRSAPQHLLDGLNLANYLTTQFAATTNQVHVTAARAAKAQQRAQSALFAARANQAALAQQRASLEREQQKFQQLLDSLTTRQRREVAHARAVAAAQARAALLAQQQSATTGLSPGTVPLHGVSAAVRRVVAFAEAQVGKPYVFDASGPAAYDCSGLTMQAWAQAGVALPHSAAEQYTYGTHVAYGQLQPGDLIFLYSPIEHVELYVGNDLAVSASDPSLGIIYVHPSQDIADYAGATRLAG
jgi:cell wall-associated NlpC family hydrolase